MLQYNIISVSECNPEICMIINFEIQSQYEVSFLGSATFLLFIQSFDLVPFNTWSVFKHSQMNAPPSLSLPPLSPATNILFEL
jgi:hypothetical protein